MSDEGYSSSDEEVKQRMQAELAEKLVQLQALMQEAERLELLRSQLSTLMQNVGDARGDAVADDSNAHGQLEGAADDYDSIPEDIRVDDETETHDLARYRHEHSHIDAHLNRVEEEDGVASTEELTDEERAAMEEVVQLQAMLHQHQKELELLQLQAKLQDLLALRETLQARLAEETGQVAGENDQSAEETGQISPISDDEAPIVALNPDASQTHEQYGGYSSNNGTVGMYTSGNAVEETKTGTEEVSAEDAEELERMKAALAAAMDKSAQLTAQLESLQQMKNQLQSAADLMPQEVVDFPEEAAAGEDDVGTLEELQQLQEKLALLMRLQELLSIEEGIGEAARQGRGGGLRSIEEVAEGLDSFEGVGANEEMTDQRGGEQQAADDNDEDGNEDDGLDAEQLQERLTLLLRLQRSSDIEEADNAAGTQMLSSAPALSKEIATIENQEANALASRDASVVVKMAELLQRVFDAEEAIKSPDEEEPTPSEVEAVRNLPALSDVHLNNTTSRINVRVLSPPRVVSAPASRASADDTPSVYSDDFEEEAGQHNAVPLQQPSLQDIKARLDAFRQLMLKVDLVDVVFDILAEENKEHGTGDDDDAASMSSIPLNDSLESFLQSDNNGSLVQSGYPTADAFARMADYSSTPPMVIALRAVREAVREGLYLALAETGHDAHAAAPNLKVVLTSSTFRDAFQQALVDHLAADAPSFRELLTQSMEMQGGTNASANSRPRMESTKSAAADTSKVDENDVDGVDRTTIADHATVTPSISPQLQPTDVSMLRTAEDWLAWGKAKAAALTQSLESHAPDERFSGTAPVSNADIYADGVSKLHVSSTISGRGINETSTLRTEFIAPSVAYNPSGAKVSRFQPPGKALAQALQVSTRSSASASAPRPPWQRPTAKGKLVQTQTAPAAAQAPATATGSASALSSRKLNYGVPIQPALTKTKNSTGTTMMPSLDATVFAEIPKVSAPQRKSLSNAIQPPPLPPSLVPSALVPGSKQSCIAPGGSRGHHVLVERHLGVPSTVAGLTVPTGSVAISSSTFTSSVAQATPERKSPSSKKHETPKWLKQALLESPATAEKPVLITDAASRALSVEDPLCADAATAAAVTAAKWNETVTSIQKARERITLASSRMSAAEAFSARSPDRPAAPMRALETGPYLVSTARSPLPSAHASPLTSSFVPTNVSSREADEAESVPSVEDAMSIDTAAYEDLPDTHGDRPSIDTESDYVRTKKVLFGQGNQEIDMAITPYPSMMTSGIPAPQPPASINGREVQNEAFDYAESVDANDYGYNVAPDDAESVATDDHHVSTQEIAVEDIPDAVPLAATASKGVHLNGGNVMVDQTASPLARNAQGERREQSARRPLRAFSIGESEDAGSISGWTQSESEYSDDDQDFSRLMRTVGGVRVAGHPGSERGAEHETSILADLSASKRRFVIAAKRRGRILRDLRKRRALGLSVVLRAVGSWNEGFADFYSREDQQPLTLDELVALIYEMGAVLTGLPVKALRAVSAPGMPLPDETELEEDFNATVKSAVVIAKRAMRRRLTRQLALNAWQAALPAFQAGLLSYAGDNGSRPSTQKGILRDARAALSDWWAIVSASVPAHPLMPVPSPSPVREASLGPSAAEPAAEPDMGTLEDFPFHTSAAAASRGQSLPCDPAWDADPSIGMHDTTAQSFTTVSTMGQLARTERQDTPTSRPMRS